ncbi:MAG: tRNA adenosine(34) deaminase TadA [Eubacterium sp.]|nr:tRNA adenosine(34) deaminase TadA [Eubacterium sp.]
MDHEMYMKEAYRLAKKAYRQEETPIGCVIVRDDRIIGKGYNRRNKKKNSLAHAEIMAISQACRKVGDWRLEDCTMYVTLEPCPMCAGAIVQARMPLVVIGARNPKAGCAGSVINILDMEGLNHRVELVEGVMREECEQLMTGFFKELRDKKKKQ